MKLTNKNTNEYHINNCRKFNGNSISKKILLDSFNFSYQMIFEDGHHRKHRSGGLNHRKKGELFANTFQGKIAEFIVFQELINSGLENCTAPDISINGKGIWDDVDLIYANKKINIKSTVFFANLFLLEKKDWNLNGEYIPNLKKDGTNNYDYFILVRIKPDLKKILKEHKLFYSDTISKEILKELIFKQKWTYDFGGICSIKTIKHIIKEEYCIPQHSLLNGSIKMDASNYYIQCGDLKEFDYLVEELSK
jgi:hypothetical protein